MSFGIALCGFTVWTVKGWYDSSKRQCIKMLSKPSIKPVFFSISGCPFPSGYWAIPDEFCTPSLALLELGVKTTAWIHVIANHMEGTFGIGFHFQLEMTHLDMPFIGEGCRIENSSGLANYSRWILHHPLPHERHFLNWGWKWQLKFMSQLNLMEGTSGIGFHFQLEMSYLDMPSIEVAEFIWNSQFPGIMLRHLCLQCLCLLFLSCSFLKEYVCRLSWIHAL